MRATRFGSCIGLLLGGLCLWAPQSAHARALAESCLSFSNLQLTAPLGTVELLSDWSLEAFAEARNSRGELNQQGAPGAAPGAASAAAVVTWAEGHGHAAAPAAPPDLNVTADANSRVDLPAVITNQFATSSGRGTLFTTFTISGGTGAVGVDFSVDVTRFLHVLTQDNGVVADTDTTFALTVFAGDLLEPLTPLFFHDRLRVGPNDEARRTGSLPPVVGTALLTFGETYAMVVESDAEAFGVVPEPSTLALLLLSLGILAGVKPRPF